MALTAPIDWTFLERDATGFFRSATDRPVTVQGQMAGPLYLQHAFRLSDPAVVSRWFENPF